MHPILFKLGPFTVYSYGVFITFACLITTYLIIKDSLNYGIPKDKMWDLLILIIISGIVGARLLHVFLNFSYYKETPLEILMLHRGGLAIHGAIIAAVFISILFLFKNRLPLGRTGDLIMQYLPLGQAIGRIGCFLNGCCYGKPTASFFQVRHPTQVYSSIALLAVFIILRYISGKKRRFDGEIFLIYFIIYAPLRFFLDFLRGDLSMVLFGLTISQLIGIILFLVAFSIYYIKLKTFKI